MPSPQKVTEEREQDAQSTEKETEARGRLLDPVGFTSRASGHSV